MAIKCLPGLPTCNTCRDTFSYSQKVDAVIYDTDLIPTDWTSADLVQLGLAALDQAGVSAHSLAKAEERTHGRGILHTLWHLDLIESCDLCSAAPGEAAPSMPTAARVSTSCAASALGGSRERLHGAGEDVGARGVGGHVDAGPMGARVRRRAQ